MRHSHGSSVLSARGDVRGRRRGGAPPAAAVAAVRAGRRARRERLLQHARSRSAPRTCRRGRRARPAPRSPAPGCRPARSRRTRRGCAGSTRRWAVALPPGSRPRVTCAVPVLPAIGTPPAMRASYAVPFGSLTTPYMPSITYERCCGSTLDAPAHARRELLDQAAVRRLDRLHELRHVQRAAVGDRRVRPSPAGSSVTRVLPWPMAALSVKPSAVAVAVLLHVPLARRHEARWPRC